MIFIIAIEKHLRQLGGTCSITGSWHVLLKGGGVYLHIMPRAACAVSVSGQLQAAQRTKAWSHGLTCLSLLASPSGLSLPICCCPSPSAAVPPHLLLSLPISCSLSPAPALPHSLSFSPQLSPWPGFLSSFPQCSHSLPFPLAQCPCSSYTIWFSVCSPLSQKPFKGFSLS